MALYRVTAQVVTIRASGRTSVGVPTFWVSGQDAEGAATSAHLVLAADRRDDDPHPFELHGTVIIEDDRSDYASFSYTRAGLAIARSL